MINIKNLDSNNIKRDEKPHKNILIYHIGYVTALNLRYAKFNSVNLLYLIINKINRHIDENNEVKYLTLVLTDEGKDTLKTYEELWNKIRDLIRSITNNSDDYDEKYIKIKFNLNDDLLLNKTLELRNMVIVVRSVFYEDNNTIHKLF